AIKKAAGFKRRPKCHVFNLDDRCYSAVIVISCSRHNRRNLGSRAIHDRCVACYVRRSQNWYLAVVRFAYFDGLKRRSCQNSTDRSATAVWLWHAGRDTNVVVSALSEESGRHSITVFLSNRVNNVEIVVDFGRAEVQCGSILAADCFLPV